MLCLAVAVTDSQCQNSAVPVQWWQSRGSTSGSASGDTDSQILPSPRPCPSRVIDMHCKRIDTYQSKFGRIAVSVNIHTISCHARGDHCETSTGI